MHVDSPSSLGRAPPTEFIQRSGSKLYVGACSTAGHDFKAVGPNVYWLGLDENIGDPPAISYPSQERVVEIMATAAAMGATAIRAHTLGISVEHALSVQPSLGVVNEEALRVVDFAVYAARAYGLRLIIPLVDQWDYYHGGRQTFLRFRNLATCDPSAFYENTDVISDFRAYISVIVNRVNTYTGIANRAEPTIMAWETGNELKAPPCGWTAEISAYLKQLAPRQLVVDGAYGVQPDALDIDTVDIYSNHYYPLNAEKMQRDATAVLASGKAFYVGEFDWTDKRRPHSHFGHALSLLIGAPAMWLGVRTSSYLPAWCCHPSSLSDFLLAVEKSGAIGSAYWSLFGRDDAGLGWVEHSDGFTLHYRRKGSAEQALLLAIHAHRWSRREMPCKMAHVDDLPIVACPQKLLATGDSGR